MIPAHSACLKVSIAISLGIVVVCAATAAVESQQSAGDVSREPDITRLTLKSEGTPLEPPRVFLLNGKALELNRLLLRGQDKKLSPALAALQVDAKAAMGAGPFSVLDKSVSPPSGDKHDFMSQAPYFWPDTNSADGRPYVRRDGERNPEIYKVPDRRSLGRMTSAVETLALAYYFTANEAYAEKAAKLLRGWFLDPSTRMNPNFEFAQAVPGQNTGRGTGLIEAVGFTSIVDAIGLLGYSTAWTKTDQAGMVEWFSRFLQWMQESKNGRAEAAAQNNHGTYYDVQVAAYALFLGKDDLARQVLQAARQKRIAPQIEPDGRQPLELQRTRSWSYSLMNLRGLFSLATLGQHVGVDLWTYQTDDGRSIRKALDFLAPFAVQKEKKWPYQQLGQFNPQELFPLLRKAARAYPDPKYGEVVSLVLDVKPTDRAKLLSQQ